MSVNSTQNFTDYYYIFEVPSSNTICSSIFFLLKTSCAIFMSAVRFVMDILLANVLLEKTRNFTVINCVSTNRLKKTVTK